MNAENRDEDLPDIETNNKTSPFNSDTIFENVIGNKKIAEHQKKMADDLNTAINEDVIPLYRKTKTSLKECNDQVKKLMDFYKHQLASGNADFVMGKSRIVALENLQSIATNMDKADTDLNLMLLEIQKNLSLGMEKQMAPQALGLSQQGTTNEETEEESGEK